jgi:hypothetical protein
MSGYRYQISRNIGFTNIVQSGFIATTGVTLTITGAGNYYRRVQSVDQANNTSARSTGRLFSIYLTPEVSTGYISL